MKHPNFVLGMEIVLAPPIGVDVEHGDVPHCLTNQDPGLQRWKRETPDLFRYAPPPGVFIGQPEEVPPVAVGQCS